MASQKGLEDPHNLFLNLVPQPLGLGAPCIVLCEEPCLRADGDSIRDLEASRGRHLTYLRHQDGVIQSFDSLPGDGGFPASGETLEDDNQSSQ